MSQRESKVHTSLNSVSSGLLYPTQKHTHTYTYLKINVIKQHKSAAFKKIDTCRAASDLHG